VTAVIRRLAILAIALTLGIAAGLAGTLDHGESTPVALAEGCNWLGGGNFYNPRECAGQNLTWLVTVPGCPSNDLPDLQHPPRLTIHYPGGSYTGPFLMNWNHFMGRWEYAFCEPGGATHVWVTTWPDFALGDTIPGNGAAEVTTTLLYCGSCG
jgi:hypothetical protein